MSSPSSLSSSESSDDILSSLLSRSSLVGGVSAGLVFGSSWWAGGVSTDGSTSAGAGATGAREGLLGAEQLNKVEKLLSSEAAMLAEAKDKVQQLNKRIAQLKPVRDLPSTSRTVEGDYSLSFANTSFGLPTSSTAPNLAHLASRHSHSRTGSGFVA